MSDETEAAERALRRHDAYEATEVTGRYAVVRTPFDATVRVAADGNGSVTYRVEIRLPTIDGVVVDETVADVVQEGWFETLARRLEDIDGALRVTPTEPVVELEHDVDEVRVETTFTTPKPGVGADEAKSIVDYVEGTYVQGVIPGYEYREPVAGLIEAARARAGADDDAQGGIPPG